MWWKNPISKLLKIEAIDDDGLSRKTVIWVLFYGVPIPFKNCVLLVTNLVYFPNNNCDLYEEMFNQSLKTHGIRIRAFEKGFIGIRFLFVIKNCTC